jgi:thiol-disulfide isomerase/thioredoxin
VCFCLPFSINAQPKGCNLQKSRFSDIYTVNVEQARCLAQNSDKDITIFYIYADWCNSLRKILLGAIELSKKYDTDFYLLLRDNEIKGDYFNEVVHRINSVYNGGIKALIISDSLYSERNRIRFSKPNRRKIVDFRAVQRIEKTKNFVKGLTPPEFECATPGLIFIVLNKKGETVSIPSHKNKTFQEDMAEIVQAIEDYRRKN